MAPQQSQNAERLPSQSVLARVAMPFGPVLQVGPAKQCGDVNCDCQIAVRQNRKDEALGTMRRTVVDLQRCILRVHVGFGTSLMSRWGVTMRIGSGKGSLGGSIFCRWNSSQSSKYFAHHARRGWNRVDALLRSPVSHPLGYPLVLLFDWLENMRSKGDKSSDMKLQSDGTACSSGWKLQDTQQRLVYLGKGANRLNFCEAAQRAHDRQIELFRVLNPLVEAWNHGQRSEGDLIQAICGKSMGSSNSSSSGNPAPCPLSNLHLRTIGQRGQEDGHIYLWGKYDMILADPATKNLINVFVLGKGEESMWWTRTLQGLQCQDILYGETRDPRLWIVRDDLESDDPLPAHVPYTMPSLLTTISYDENGGHFRMGVFLCWYAYYMHKDLKNCRRFHSLLWEQYDTVGQGSFSASLAAILAVSDTFNQWRTINVDQSEYQSLGYDCAKVLWQEDGKSTAAEKVLRCFDSRISPLYRTPAIYLNSTMFTAHADDIANDTTAAATTKPPRVTPLPCPTRPLYPTPQSPNNVNDLKRPNHTDWIWTAGNDDGQLNIVVVPYWIGRHVAQRPTDFIPIMQQLRQLHEQNLVHGDIRCSNMVIDGAVNGRLIDYDFGGVHGQVRYPPRYDKYPGDGNRFGEGGELIEMWHDWYAVGQVIFRLHRFDPPPPEATAAAAAEAALPVSKDHSRMDNCNDQHDAMLLEMLRFERVFRKVPDDDLDAILLKVERLVGLLQRMDAEGWTCQPYDMLERWLQRMDGIAWSTGRCPSAWKYQPTDRKESERNDSQQ